MPFVENMLRYKSVSFVGMEKNAGKTQALNYVLGRLRTFFDKKIAVSSIGIDGETTDQVTKTAKPEITLQPDTIFVTSQGLYGQREIVSCITDVSRETTALGRLVTARAISSGKVLLAGPSGAKGVKDLIERLSSEVDICLIDGALSRMSFGSPSITEAMVLSTGAALSASLPTVVRKTKFVYDMPRLPIYSGVCAKELQDLESGIYAVANSKVEDLQIPSLLMIEKYKDKVFASSDCIYVAGVLSEKFLQYARLRKNVDKIRIIIRDFTKVFATPETVYQFLRQGGRLEVLESTNLIAITANPVSPSGYNFDNAQMLSALRQAIPIDIYNVNDL